MYTKGTRKAIEPGTHITAPAIAWSVSGETPANTGTPP
jgi:hypothetical protein